MQILIPMVGAGQRFRDAGYRLPKPLIEVDGTPMIVRVVEDLPPTDRLVLVVNRQHVAEFHIDQVLRSYFPSADIVIAPGLTEGQACSVQLGIPALDPQESVLVAACDNTHIFDAEKFRRLTQTPEVDALIWTYRHEPRVLIHPQWYGWVQTESGSQGRVAQVSVKKPLSDNPLQDHVVSGSFWFRSGQLLAEGIERLLAANDRVNNEFYLDSVPAQLMKQGCQVRVMEVEKYIGWGTPADYEDYQRWSNYVHRRIARPAA
ncbi:MAG: NTP transferase domain-containing protein [Planctomycetales bacterium]|nr:NTP transferase domain-containing protein [Planctomycetales bacterium]